MNTTITKFNFTVDNENLPVVTSDGRVEDYNFAQYVENVRKMNYELDDSDYDAVKKFINNGKKNGWLQHILVAYPFIGNDDSARVPVIDKVSDFEPLVKFRTPLFTYLDNGKVKTANASGGTGTVSSGNGFLSPFTLDEFIKKTPSYINDNDCIFGLHHFIDIDNGVRNNPNYAYSLINGMRWGLDGNGGFVMQLSSTGRVSIKFNSTSKSANTQWNERVMSSNNIMVITGINAKNGVVYYNVIDTTEIDNAKNIYGKVTQSDSNITRDIEFVNKDYPIGIGNCYIGDTIGYNQKTDSVFYVALSDGLMTSSENLTYANDVRKLLTELGKIDIGEVVSE